MPEVDDELVCFFGVQPEVLEEMIALISECWRRDPSQRLQFEEISKRLSRLSQQFQEHQRRQIATPDNATGTRHMVEHKDT